MLGNTTPWMTLTSVDLVLFQQNTFQRKIKVDMASEDLKHLSSTEFVAGKPPDSQNEVFLFSRLLPYLTYYMPFSCCVFLVI